ncbi:MAG TPA: 3TM-type holin [Terriglobia bacterium]|nr:3TM-type holin [Terriglobia bacterium]
MDVRNILGKIGLATAKAGVDAAGAIPGVGPVIQALTPELLAVLKSKMPDVAQQQALDAAAQAASDDLAKAELNYQVQIAQIASANITADSSSNDWFVRRARPAFLWVMILAIFFSVIVFPILNLIDHRGLMVLDIPSGYLDLFGIAFTGYAVARTTEKVKGKD